jgi:hypothetical protein
LALILLVCANDDSERSPLLLRPPFAWSFTVAGVLLVFLAYVALPLLVLSPLVASFGGGLVGCGVAGIYCSRGRRTGRS